MLALKKIAVTGGIASGKSTVCLLLKELGAYVISADDIVHQILLPETHLGKEIIALLGDDVVVKGSFDRKAIAQKVFRNPFLLKSLEQLIHPEVQRCIESHYQRVSHARESFSLFVVEIPLLYESKMERFYDIVILITADETISKQRFKHEEDEFTRRSARLIPTQEKRKKADFVLENNGTIAALKADVERLYKHLTSR